MSQIEYCEKPQEKSWNSMADIARFCAVIQQSDLDAWLVDTESADIDAVWITEPDILAIPDRKGARLKPEFEALAKQWKRETAIAGQLSKIVMHPAYQRIMAMGPDVIPLIVEQLSKEPGHWFWALHNLVPPGDDPAEGTTTIREATAAWLEWAKAREVL
jgi:hypothetical protein